MDWFCWLLRNIFLPEHFDEFGFIDNFDGTTSSSVFLCGLHLTAETFFAYDAQILDSHDKEIGFLSEPFWSVATNHPGS